ncbi:AAA family ATPase [Nocardia nova]
MIDVAKRFPSSTVRTAYENTKHLPKWVFQDTISSSLTMIYGRSSVGKSFVVTSMLLSLLVEDREFLGMQPVDPTKLWKPVILWTDPNSDNEYGDRFTMAYPDRPDVDVPCINIGRTTREDEWQALTDYLVSQGYNFVVLDNLMGATGDSNDQQIMTTVLEGLSRLTNHGIPVVMLHHESEKGYCVAGAAPMGASVAVQKSRAWIQVRQTKQRGMRGGNTALIVKSNMLEQPQEIIAVPGAGPTYTVSNRGPWVEKKKDEDDKPAKEKRSKDTYDERADMARWVVDNCQGKGLNATATALAEKFGKSSATCKEQLMRGALDKLLDRTGNGTAATWSLK